jgi:class 3 adenylate cyclase
MTFKEDLEKRVQQFAQESWGETPDGYVVPAPEDLSFGNTGRRLKACILYADIADSTKMVDALPDTMAAEYYKAFLHCSAKILKRNSGEIIAYDGDRVMAVFLGDKKEDGAVGAALEIGYAVDEIINPRFSALYTTSHRKLQHTIGIDTGRVLVSKTGVRVDSDLVWVGAAANYAAKLNSFSGLDKDFPIRITQEVFASLSEASLLDSAGESMWQGPYTNLDPRRHYRSRFRRSFT